jgi:hypothetical protein
VITTPAYSPLPPELSGSWLRLGRIFGPGAVIASVTVSTGKTGAISNSYNLFNQTQFSGVDTTARFDPAGR